MDQKKTKAKGSLRKNLLVLLITLVMLISIIPSTAFAVDNGDGGTDQGSVVDTTGVDEGSANKASGGTGEDNNTPATPTGDATKIVTLYAPDGVTVVSTVGVNDATAAVLGWTLPDYAVDASVYPDQTFAGWSDGVNLYPVGYVMQNLTADMSLTAALQGVTGAEAAVARAPRSGNKYVITWNLPDGSQETQEVTEGGTVAAAGGKTSPVLTSVDDPSGNEGEFRGWFYDDGAGNLKQFYDNTTTIFNAYSLQAVFGDLPSNAQAAPAVQKSYLLDLVPNLNLTATEITSGKDYTAILTGSLSLPTGVWLEDVVFTFKVKSTNHLEQFVILKNNANPGEFGAFEVNVVDSYTIQVKVYRMESRTGGGSIEFGRFQFMAPNVITPDGLQAQIELESISSGGVVLNSSEWQGQSPAWSVQQTATVKAEGGWIFENTGVTRSPAQFKRYEGDGTNTNDIWETSSAVSGVPYFSITAKENSKTTGYVHANSASVQVKISAGGSVVIPEDVVTEFATSKTIFGNAVFEEYYALSNAADLQAAGWAATAQMVGDDLVLTFKNANVSAIDAFRTSLSVLKVEVASSALPLASSQVNGTYTMAYVSGADSAITYPSVGATGDVKSAAITGGAAGTVTIQFLAETSVASEVDKYLGASYKNLTNWYYNPNGHDTNAQYGDSTSENTTYRNFVSDGSYTIPGSTKTINLNRIWFDWSLMNSYASGTNGRLPITELVLSETAGGATTGTGAGWNASQMNPVGFEVPAAGADTKLIIRVTINGTEYDIYDSSKGTPVATVTGFSLVDGKIIYSGTSPITKFEYIYKVTGTATGITVASKPRVMFEVVAGLTMADNSTIYNYSYLNATFATSSGSAAKDKVQSSSVKYRVIEVTPTGTKSVENLTRSDGYRPGDLLKYTLRVQVSTILPAAHSKGLLLADVAGENITLNPSEMHTQVTITHGSNSKQFAGTTPTDLAPVHGKTAGQYSYTDVPSVNSTGTALLNPLVPVTTPAAGTAHYYAFTGNIYAGDVITITYFARVAEGAADNAPLYNSLWYEKDWSIGGGGGTGTKWEKLDDNDVSVAMDHAYGDISVQVRGANADGTVGGLHSYYLPGETFYLDILGGLVESSEQVENPVFLVQLPSDVRFASDTLVDVARKSLTLDTTAGNRVVGDSTDPINYSVQWLADDGSGFAEVPYGEATHMRLTVNGTLGKSVGNKLFSELVAFKVAVEVVDVPTLSSTGVAAYNIKVAMSAQDGTTMKPSIASNHKYESNTAGGWPGKTSGHETLNQGGVFGTALQYGSSASDPAAASFKYVYDLSGVNIYSRSTQAAVTKERAAYPTKPTTTQPQEGLYLNDTLEFTVKVSSPTFNNLNANYNTPGTFHPGPVVDILPLGMTYEQGTAVANVDGVDIPVSVSTGTTTDGRQRLVITLNDSTYQLEYGKTFVLKYTAKVISIDHFAGTHSYTDHNKASMYIDPEEVYAKAAIEAAGDTAEWRDGVAVDAGYSRLQAKDVEVILKDKRIVPGLNKTATSDTVVITTSATVTWKLTITNDTTADLPIEGYYVVDVLPKDFTFAGMVGGGPAPQQFVNKNGQVVLLWTFDASNPLAIGGSQDLTYRASTLAYNDDGMLMTGYFTNTAYMRPTTQLFEDASVKVGTPVHAGNTTYSGDLTLPNGSTVIPLGRAITNHHTVMLSSIIGAVAENRAAYNGSNTSSSTSYKLIETEREKTVNYSFDLSNTGSWEFEDVRVFNTLPYAGDYYTMRSDLRGSNFAMLLKDTVQFSATVNGNPVSGITVYYSSTPVHGRAAVMEDANWTEASSWDWGKNGLPKSFRVDMPAGFTLKSGEKLVLNWQLDVPDDVLVETQTNPAYNSAGYYFAIADSKYFAEPERVGVYVKDTGLSDLTVQIQKLLQDVEMRSGEQRAFAFRLEKYNPTTGGYDPVHLDAQSGLVLTGVTSLHVASDPSTYGMFQLMAVNNATVTGSISKLPSGTYRVVEIMDHIYSWILYRYNVTGDGQEQYIGFVRGGTTIRSATYLIKNVYDGYYIPSSSVSTVPPVTPSGSTPGSTTVIASGTGSGSGGLSTLTIVPSQPPLVEPTQADTWALLNLICAIFSAGSGLLLLVLLLIKTLRKGKDDEEDEAETPVVDEETDRNERRTNVIWRLVSALVGIASLVTFILTQDMRNDMVFVDKWTPLMLAFALVTIFSLISMWYSQRKRDDEDDDYYYSAT